MKKLLQFLSIGILSSSALTSVTACNNKEQNNNNNLNKKDEHQEQLKEVQNNELETNKEINEILNIKEENDSKDTNKNIISPTPVPRNRLKRELNPVPAPRTNISIKKDDTSFLNELETQEQDFNNLETSIDNQQENKDVVEKLIENHEDFEFIDEYIEDNEQEELLTVEKEDENLNYYIPDFEFDSQEQEMTIDEIVNSVNNLAKDINDLAKKQEQDLQEIDNQQENKDFENVVFPIIEENEVIKKEQTDKNSEIILANDIKSDDNWKEDLNKKIIKTKTLSANLESKEQELIDFKEQINNNQKTLEKVENNLFEISKELTINLKKPKRKIGVIIDDIYHDGSHEKIKIDSNLNQDLTNKEQDFEYDIKQEVSTKKPMFLEKDLKKHLDKIDKIFKKELERNIFYIKGGKAIFHSIKEQMLFETFLPIFSKLPNHNDYKYRIDLVTTDNSEKEYINYIIETKLKKPKTNKPLHSKIGYATISVNSVIINKNQSLIKEFKNKLENILVKSKFKILEKESQKAAFFIKEQTDKIINKLNKEKRYNFNIEDVHLFVFKNQQFQLNLKISKPLPNSLASLTEQSVSIKLPYKIIE